VCAKEVLLYISDDLKILNTEVDGIKVFTDSDVKRFLDLKPLKPKSKPKN
jgi:hypothetical protein